MSQPEQFIVYRRVSTREQGQSGLGLEAQLVACKKHVAEVGGEIIAEFSEVASGANDHRPQFVAAIKRARRTGATLLVAKLDRVSRAVHLIAGMLADGLPLTVAEIPNASTLELHLRAVIAQEERDAASKRTKAALAVAKANGTKLGSSRPGHWDGLEDRRALGQRRATEAAAAVRRAKNVDLVEEVGDLIEKTAELSLRAVAAELEERGILTARGKRTWSPAQVQRLRAALLTA